MSDSSFIKDEIINRSAGIIRLNWRMFRELHLFWKFVPFTIVVVILASVAPSYFRWYCGQYLDESSHFTLSGIVTVIGLSIFLRILAWVSFEISGMLSSHRIYEKMIRSLGHTRTTFFDENPSGRLINRLVVDFDELRSTGIIFVGDFFNASIEILSIGMIACFANPWVGFLVAPLIMSFSYIQYQRSAMLEHSRGLSAQAKSSVLGRSSDIIEGRELFLLFNKAEILLNRTKDSFRTYVEASTLSAQIEAWGSFWIRVSGEVFAFIVLIFMSFALSRGRIEIPIAGVIISALIGISGSLGWLDLATSLVSRSAPHIRRVFELIDLPPEEKEERKSQINSNPDLSLRNSGDIVFQDFSMSYRKDTPLTLENFNLCLDWGKKTAIIGRTGSGKTSLIQALLRMVYVQNGSIRIGNQSIYDLNLQQYRTLFGVVPQSPYLFEGTIRSNLDRSEQLNTSTLENALYSVGLNFSLEKKIHEGGQNLSQGERQLLCLARVIATDRKIILMDEPTSGLDPETDARIHRILHTTLRNKTVLTIAHRKESLGDYDWVVEMNQGKLVEKRKGVTS